MDVLKIVENIQRICKERGTTPTVAGKESGAGKDLVSAMKKRGVLPSIEKMRLLADYLGVTTSELLGEDVTHSGQDHSQPDILVKFNALDSDDQEEVQAIIEMKLARKQSGK